MKVINTMISPESDRESAVEGLKIQVLFCKASPHIGHVQ